MQVRKWTVICVTLNSGTVNIHSVQKTGSELPNMCVTAIDVYFRYLDNSLITSFLNFTFMENSLNQNV